MRTVTIVAVFLLAALAVAIPDCPQTFEADVTVTDSLIPFPIQSHLYFDFPRGMQRMDYSNFGTTRSRIDNMIANLTFIVDTTFGQSTCKTCFFDDFVYPMQVPIFCTKTGEETVNSILCEIWEGDFGFQPFVYHLTFAVQKAMPHANVRSIFELQSSMMPHKTQLDFKGIRVGPIPEPVWNPNATCSDPTCKVPLELLLLIDGSGSISSSDFDLMRQFAVKVVKQFTLANDAVRVGVVQFSNKAIVHSELSSDTVAVQKAITSMVQIGSGTNMDIGLEQCLSMIVNKGRSGVDSSVIMFTDGVPDSGTNPVAVAKKLKDRDITIYTVGVGNGVNPALLKQIASDPPETHAFLADSFAKLQSLLKEIIEHACQGDTCASS